MPIQWAAVPDNLSTVLICVDSVRDGDIAGRVRSPYTDRGAAFCGVLDLVRRMEKLFDGLHFPQPMFSYRTFQELGRRRGAVRMRPAQEEQARRYHGDELFRSERGELGTFIVHVEFRRNATWQGTIRWMERGRERRFCSLLELLKLLDSALPQETRPKAGWGLTDRRS